MNGTDTIIVRIDGPQGERLVPVAKSTFILGYGIHSDVDLGSDTVAEKQTRITFTGGEFWVEDLSSRTGTYLNGRRLTRGKRARMTSADRLSFGTTHALTVGVVVSEAQQVVSEILVGNGASISLVTDPVIQEERQRTDLSLVSAVEGPSALEIMQEEYEACRERLTKSLAEERKALEELRRDRTKIEAQELQTAPIASSEGALFSSTNAADIAARLAALVQRQLLVNHGRFIDTNYAEEFRGEALKLFHDELTGNDSEESGKLKARHLQLEKKNRRKQRLYRALNLVGIVAGFLTLAVILRPDLVVKGRTSLTELFSKKRYQSAEEFARKKITMTRKRVTYAPATTAELKKSFHENVLFTTDFLPRFRGKEFQDKWIVDLNEFFIQRLDVKDTTIIRYVALEAHLLNDLEKLKASVDPRNPAPKIAQMKALELEFKEKLAKIFEDPDKVAVFYEYHQAFWQEFYPHP